MRGILPANNKILHILACLLSLGILFKTYNYLIDLEKCDCYNDLQAYYSLKIDIDFLKAYQIFEMFLTILFIVIIYYRNSPKLKIIKDTFSLTYLTLAIMLLLFFVTGYLSYNTLMLYLMSKEKCKCMDKWQKYFLYVQGIMNSLVFTRLKFLLFFVFLLFISL